MLFVHRVPAPPLDGAIASLWYCENPARPFALERVLPSGAAQLIVNLKEDRTRVWDPERSGGPEVTCGTVLGGVVSRYRFMDTAEQECVAGVAFRAGGTAAFFAAPAYEMRDRPVPVEALWGRTRAAELRERLLEAGGAAARLDVLEQALRAAWRSAGMHAAAGFALRAFAAGPEAARIVAVAEGAGLSAKRFIERFKSAVGVAPKQYCRILRFQRALAGAEQGVRVDWTRIAAECGYFDQAHFIRDFRSFAGITPGGYKMGRTEFRNHVKYVQAGGGGGMR
jgi:AraC-like DNA-binding protein